MSGRLQKTLLPGVVIGIPFGLLLFARDVPAHPYPEIALTYVAACVLFGIGLGWVMSE